MKKIIMLAAGIVLLGGGVAGGIAFSKMKSDKAPTETPVEGEIAADAMGAHGEATPAAAGAHGEAPAGAHGEAAPAAGTSVADRTYTFDKFTTNLGSLSNLLQMSLQVEAFNAEAKKQIEENVSPLRDATIMVISSKTIEDLESPLGKERLKRELMTRYEGVLGGNKIVKNLYLSDFSVVRY
jgi:flagellar FliL protein